MKKGGAPSFFIFMIHFCAQSYRLDDFCDPNLFIHDFFFDSRNLITRFYGADVEGSYPAYSFAQDVDLIFHPRELVNGYRFDVMAKYIYAQHREWNVESSWAYDLYSEHLHVMNNYHEDIPKKNCIKDFIIAFDATLDSIKQKGFVGAQSCVAINKGKINCNGNHRIAACLLYDKDVVCRYHPGNGLRAASSEFFKHFVLHVEGGLKREY